MNQQPTAEKVVITIDEDAEEGNGQGTSSGGSSKEQTSPAAHGSARIRRNIPIEAPLESLDNIMHRNISINRQTNVELVDGEFLRVIDIIRDTRTSEITLRGWLFRRTKEMNGLLERKVNEICWILHIDEDDKRIPSVQGMESIPIANVRKRRHIRMTNRPFPDLSWREDGIEEEEVILSDRVLVCRYKYVCSYADTYARQRNQWCEKALYRLPKLECDKSISMEDEVLRYSWRGETVKGGASKDFVAGEAESLEQERQCRQTMQTPQIPSRLGSVGSLVGELEMLQTWDLTRDDEWEETDLQLTTNQGAMDSRFGQGKPHSTCIDLTIDDSFPGSQASSTGNTSKARDRSSHFSRNRGSSEVVEIPPPTSFTSRPKGNRRNETGQVGSSLLRRRARAKRFINQAQWGQHHASKRINTGRGPPSDSDRAVESSRSSASGPPTHHNRESPLLIAGNTEPPKPSDQPRKQRYTFGDCFCGAGGTSRGAIGAGLRVEWGFDFSLAACQSFMLNFFAARVYNIWADQFASLPDQDHKVDICHLSPPCQYFSDAHTIQGKDDDMNIASLFSVSRLVQKARPRVVTLEQTAGLLRRHSQFLNAVVLMFTAQGFSIRWRLLRCADYGLPQNRVRVIMIASCPGEALPSFPAPTHSAHPLQTGLEPWTTINDAISRIPPNWPNHDVSAANPHDGPAQDGNQLARCMTTSGAGMIHPSGRRALTLREFAGIQSFPLEHQFSNVGVKKQIGNAVPPVVAKALLEEVKKALMKADGLITD